MALFRFICYFSLIGASKDLSMKNTVDFKNYLRSLDTLESDAIDTERQAAVAKRLESLSRPMRQRIIQNLEYHILRGRMSLRRR